MNTPEAAAPPAVAARGVVKWLGAGEQRTHVLRGVDLAVRPGEVVAVTGPSGCGKSTLLYLLGLLDRPEAGEVELAGRPTTGLDEAARTALRARAVGFVFQFHFLLPDFTALENVLLPMRCRPGRDAAARRERAAALLAAVGLGDKTGRRPSGLSGGEQQRVAVARALANDPAVVLADEPTGNLDAANSRRVFDLLLDLSRARGLAAVVATHNSDLAARCDRVCRMRDGAWVEAAGPGSGGGSDGSV